jgi:hypothetical protein
LNVGKIIVEPDDEGYAALLNGKVVVRGKTQKETGERAHELRPYDAVEAARVRTTEEGKPDEFRLLHAAKPR